MSASIDILPDEVVIRIFKELEIVDILSCSLTCRVFQTLIRDSLALQYHVQLAVAGVKDAHADSQIPIVELLSELKVLEQGWANLHFRQRHTVRIPPGRIWELFGGVLAQGIRTDDIFGTRGLLFIPLPFSGRASLTNSWELSDTGVRIRDFAMDPAQDLLTLISYSEDGGIDPTDRFFVHLRTMSTGAEHPCASVPVLLCSTTPHYSSEHPLDSFGIQIMADFVAILRRPVIGTRIDHLFIWNWKTGQLVTRLYHPRDSWDAERIDSFSFLSPRHVLVAKLYPLRSGSAPVLDVFDFLATSPEGSTAPRLLRSFQLPTLSQNAHTVYIITRSDPSPEVSPQSLTSTNRPFYPAPSSRLLTVSVGFSSNTHYAYSFMLFIHPSALLEGLEPDSVPIDVTVPWDDWGPKKTRMLPTTTNERTFVCYVHGTRYVRLEPSTERLPGVRRSHVRMLDFNPLALRRGEATELLSEAVSEPFVQAIYTTSQPTIIHPNDSVFTETVTTTLPYRDVWTRETFLYSAVMIDHDCIVGRFRNVRIRLLVRPAYSKMIYRAAQDGLRQSFCLFKLPPSCDDRIDKGTMINYPRELVNHATNEEHRA